MKKMSTSEMRKVNGGGILAAAAIAAAGRLAIHVYWQVYGKGKVCPLIGSNKGICK